METTTMKPVFTHSDKDGRLGFIRATTQAFAFLLRLGFEEVRRDATFLRFESHKIFVNVYHGRTSCQIGVEIGRIKEGDVYSLFELLFALAPDRLDQARCQTRDGEVLERCLTAIAKTLDRRCGALLSGAPEAFAELRAKIASHRKAVTLKAEFGAIIDRADHAWEKKNLELTMDLYEKAEPALDKARRRRLEYLRRKLVRSTGS